jgi:hypothetical protein
MNSVEITKVLSFNGIFTSNNNIVRVTDDNMIYAVDLTVAVTGKDRRHAAQTIRDIDEKYFDKTKFSERQLSKTGGPMTKLVSFKDAIQLIMVMPGLIANDTRAQFSDVIQRFLAGDQTLIKEIRFNATSKSPIARLAQSASDPSNINENAGGSKRERYSEDTPLQNDLLSKQLKFVQEAFDYRKDAYELKTKYATKLLENDHGNETVEDMITRVQEENQQLRKDDNEVSAYIKEIEARLEIMKSDQRETASNLKKDIEVMRILSGLHLELEQPTDYMKSITGKL